MISALRKLLLPALPNEPLRWVQAEDLWHEARILIGELAERAQAQHRLHTERLAHALTDSGATLLATQQVARADRRGRTPAAAAGDPGRLDGALRRPTAPHAPARVGRPRWRCAGATTWSAAPGGGEPAAGGPSCPPSTLLPAVHRAAGRRASVVVEPLFFHDRPLGCLLLEMGPREGIVYESLAEQVSSALEGARLVGPPRRGGDPAPGRRARSGWKKRWRSPPASRPRSCPRDVTRPRPGDRRHACTTATEVGGDYYDVVPVDDGCWIGIGDVAGHGLGTGLVMLMMQSGIGALARKLPDAAPRELLLALNAMLVDNVRDAARPARARHADAASATGADGGLTFAGAHEEILIRRAATGRCERVTTPGAWVGAKRDIAAGTVDSTARLAARRSAGALHRRPHRGDGGRRRGERFGTDRLAALVEAHGASAPAAVRDAHPRRRRRFRRAARRRRDAAGGALSRV